MSFWDFWKIARFFGSARSSCNAGGPQAGPGQENQRCALFMVCLREGSRFGAVRFIFFLSARVADGIVPDQRRSGIDFFFLARFDGAPGRTGKGCLFTGAGSGHSKGVAARRKTPLSEKNLGRVAFRRHFYRSHHSSSLSAPRSGRQPGLRG